MRHGDSIPCDTGLPGLYPGLFLFAVSSLIFLLTGLPALIRHVSRKKGKTIEGQGRTFSRSPAKAISTGSIPLCLRPTVSNIRRVHGPLYQRPDVPTLQGLIVHSNL